jgi:hypothetical protein
MIYVGVIIGAVLFMYSGRLDGPADFTRLRTIVMVGIQLVFLGVCIAWLDDQDILISLLLSEWKAGGTWGIPLGYSLLLGGLLDWAFNRKSKSE